MGRCPNCPLWIAIEGAIEVSQEFEEAAVDDPRKPGAELQKRHKIQRRIFQSIEHRIKCNYTTDDEAAEESIFDMEPVNLDEEAPAIEDDVVADQTEGTDEEVDNTSSDDPPKITKADILQALLAANAVKVMACAEPYQMELQMFAVGGNTVWPDGHLDSPSIRAKNAKDSRKGDGQYI